MHQLRPFHLAFPVASLEYRFVIDMQSLKDEAKAA